MDNATLKIIGGSAAGLGFIALVALMLGHVAGEETTDELVSRLRAQKRANPATRRRRRPAHA